MRTVLPLSDIRRDASWRSNHSQEFEKLVEQMLGAVSIGADEPGRAMGARRQIEARMGHDTFHRLPELKLPLLVCGGRYDGIAPTENLEAIVNQVAGAELDLFDGGHMFYLQDPQAFERIGAFLARAN